MQPKNLQLLDALFAHGQITEVIHFAFDGGLTECQAVSEKCEVALAEESRNDAHEQQDQKPRHENEDPDGECQGSDDLLQQAAELLYQKQAVGSLHPCTFEFVVESRIFVGCQIERGGLLHQPDADVFHVAVSEQEICKVR